MTFIGKLTRIGSPALDQPIIETANGRSLDLYLTNYPGSGTLGDLLRQRNGFFAFESALHVFSFGAGCAGYALDFWNTKEIWKGGYGSRLEDILLFAEDIFGVQFGLQDGHIVRFDPERGVVEPYADNLEAWAARVLADFSVETGYPLASQWQKANRPLAATERLLPRTLFILGGAYDIQNLYAIDAVRGMNLRLDIYQQIKNLPDGTKIKVTVR